MSHSTTIFGALVLAFVVFITVRGELPKYLAVMGISAATTTTTPAANGLLP